MSESPMNAVVGKFYRVPCVLTVKPSRLGAGWVPIVGPMHSDDGPVNFPWEHWHIDWRFVSERLYAQSALDRFGGERFVAAVVVNVREQNPVGRPLVNMDAGVQIKSKRCKRAPIPYPIEAAQKKWLPALNEQFKGCLAKNGICPHRGLPLAGHTIDGVTTCPGHGLRWRVDTGELVTP